MQIDTHIMDLTNDIIGTDNGDKILDSPWSKVGGLKNHAVLSQKAESWMLSGDLTPLMARLFFFHSAISIILGKNSQTLSTFAKFQL